MSLHFENELRGLKQQLLVMASHAEEAVRRAVGAVLEQNAVLASQVEADDDILDRFEVELDEMGIHLLAKAPLASELRLITMGMKIAHELERVGDAATTIARRARSLTEQPPFRSLPELDTLTTLVLEMLKDALDSFVQGDAAKARAVVPRDKEADALNKKMQRELASAIAANPQHTIACLDLMTVAKSLERIGDHAKNIAEEVVYLHEGRDIRHTLKPVSTA